MQCHIRELILVEPSDLPFCQLMIFIPNNKNNSNQPAMSQRDLLFLHHRPHLKGGNKGQVVRDHRAVHASEDVAKHSHIQSRRESAPVSAWTLAARW